MSVYTSLTKALEKRMSSMANCPPIARQNVAYNPTTDTTFIKTENYPTLRRSMTMGPDPFVRHEGMYRITVCSKIGVGVGANYTLVDTILDRFENTLDLWYDEVEDTLYTQDEYEILTQSGDPLIVERLIYLTVRWSEASGPYVDHPWFCTPINVHYYSYLQP